MYQPVDVTLVTVDPRNIIVVEGRNTRFDYGNIDELAESIRVNGMREPAKVQEKDGVYYLVNGHRRHKACMALIERGHVPDFLTTVIPSTENEEDILADMVIANNGKPFLPLEEAVMLQKLRDDFGWNQAQIANKIGRSLSHVSDRLCLLSADDEVKEAMQSGEIKTQEALAIVRKSHGDKEKQKEIIQRARDGETGVINRELLQGRFNKEQWGVIHSMFLSLSLYEVEPKGFEARYMDNEDPMVKEAFIAGCFQAVADLAFTEMEDFHAKVKGRIDSEREKAPIAVNAGKSAIKVEEPKVEKPKAKKAKKAEADADA